MNNKDRVKEDTKAVPVHGSRDNCRTPIQGSYPQKEDIKKDKEFNFKLKQLKSRRCKRIWPQKGLMSIRLKMMSQETPLKFKWSAMSVTKKAVWRSCIGSPAGSTCFLEIEGFTEVKDGVLRTCSEDRRNPCKELNLNHQIVVVLTTEKENQDQTQRASVQIRKSAQNVNNENGNFSLKQTKYERPKITAEKC